MSKILNKINLNYIILILILIFALEWIVVPIPNISKNIAFMGTELIVFVLLILLIKKIHKKEYKIENKKLIISSIIFLMISFVEIIYRIIVYEFDMQFFSITRIYLVAIILFFAFDSKIIKKEYIYNSLIIFITFLDLGELIYLLINNSLRTSDIAININIYMCSALLVLPILFYRVYDNKLNLLKKVIIYFNIIAIIVLVPFSGSRTAIILLIATILGMIFVMRKYLNKRNSLKIIGILFLSIISIVLIYNFIADNYAKASLYRATNIDKIIGFENDDLRKRNLETNIPSDVTTNKITKENSNQITKDEKDYTNKNSIISQNVLIENNANVKSNANVDQTEEKMSRTSDILRGQLWSEAIEKIKENPIFGKGIITLNYELSGKTVEQSPHNFILELLLSYGILGTVAYLISVKNMFKNLYLNNQKTENKLIFIGEILIFTCFALFQPIMMSLICVIVLMYTLNIKHEEIVKE